MKFAQQQVQLAAARRGCHLVTDQVRLVQLSFNLQFLIMIKDYCAARMCEYRIISDCSRLNVRIQMSGDDESGG